MVSKFIEVAIEFHEVCLVPYVVVECLHLLVGFFADDEESYAMVGIDICKIVDIGGHIFEDKHDIISSI